MKVILHIGAHRCATTTFQAYLRGNSTTLAAQGTGFWGPRRTRKGLFSGLLPRPGAARGRDLQRRATGRIRMQLARSAGLGVQHLVVSDENMLGSVRSNLHLGSLYCGVGECMARFAEAFGEQAEDVILNVRAQGSYWTSALGYAVSRGAPVPSEAKLEAICSDPRNWRDVITDLACAMPDATIRVAPFEIFAGRPEAQLRALTGLEAPRAHARECLNATPLLPQLRSRTAETNVSRLPDGDGRWQPFSPVQCARMRSRYADDMAWLAHGADGLARLLDDPEKIKAGQNPPWTDKTRGRRHEFEKRSMARAR